MSDPLRLPTSETELEVLKALWDHGPGTVRDISRWLRGRRWAYTTVLTLLQRLESKLCVQSDKSSTAHVFHPTVTREHVLKQRLQDLANQFCQGTATPLVQALVQGRRLSNADIQHFRQMLDEFEAKAQTKTVSSRKRLQDE